VSRVVAYDENGEFTFFNFKRAKAYSLVCKGISDSYHDPRFPGTDFLFDGIVKTADQTPRWFLSGNVSPARWLGRTASKPRTNGRDYLEVTPKYAGACFIKYKRRLPPELAAVVDCTSEAVSSEAANQAATPVGGEQGGCATPKDFARGT